MPHRVASLLPSATEMVCALGAEAELVGVSHECDFPPSVKSQRVLTRARLRPVRSSRSRPRVLAVEWLDPIMIAGMWMPELIALAGATPMVTGPGEHAPTLSLEALAALDPDVLLIKPCGFSLERTLEELALLKTNLPWDSWSCVREGRVFVADGNAYFNRSGPRIVESLEILAACVHPSIFPEFRHKHRGSAVRVAPSLAVQAFDA